LASKEIKEVQKIKEIKKDDLEKLFKGRPPFKNKKRFGAATELLKGRH
jgi:hypothetical protein